MDKFINAFRKELLLLRRDLGSVIIIFIMPLILVVVVTMIQDSTFKNMEGAGIPVVFVDHDHGDISRNILKNLNAGKSFKVIPQTDENRAKADIFSGKYNLAIVVPQNLSQDINLGITSKVEKIVSTFGAPVSDESIKNISPPAIPSVRLYFDPATNLAFKENVKTAITKMAFEIENRQIYAAFQKQLGVAEPLEPQKDLITFNEILPKAGGAELRPNTVQHNIPAWALFAMFFIVLPLSISIIKEKKQGTAIRLKTVPTPYYILFFGKIFTYLLICICQFLMMLAVGKYLFPLIGLPAFALSGKFFPMLAVTFFAALAAVGFGLLLGTVANSQEQSSAFGATAVVILAAIGGIWLPVFMMPPVMQQVAKFSPLNWGLEAYYSIILRNGTLSSVAPELSLLLVFFAATVLISIIYEKRASEV